VRLSEGTVDAGPISGTCSIPQRRQRDWLSGSAANRKQGSLFITPVDRSETSRRVCELRIHKLDSRSSKIINAIEASDSGLYFLISSVSSLIITFTV
jgi:hypothetical protein